MASDAESSVTSSQLDDIEFRPPARKVYEPEVEGLRFAPQSQSQSRCGADELREPEFKRLTYDPPLLPRSGFPAPGSVPAPPATRRERDIDSRKPALTSRAAELTRPHTRLMEDSGAALDSDSTLHGDIRATPCPAISNGSIGSFVQPRGGAPASTITVDFLTPICLFPETIWRQGGAPGRGPAEMVTQMLQTRLGIDRAAMRFYEINEVHPNALQSSGHYAVHIERAGYTLSDMEDLLGENQRLSELNEKSAANLESIQELLKEFDADRSRAHLQCAEYKAEVRRLQERLKIAESHAKVLKQQLMRSDQQRLEGKQQLDQLKEEFADLTRALPRRAPAGMMPLSARR